MGRREEGTVDARSLIGRAGAVEGVDRSRQMGTFGMQVGDAVFLLTRAGNLMPAHYAGPVAERTDLALVEAPWGKVFTCQMANLFDEETGRGMLSQKRAERMAVEGYRIAVRLDSTCRVYNPDKHGAHGGWVVSRGQDGRLGCNCPAARKVRPCKHVLAVCMLLIRQARLMDAQGKVCVASRYGNLANRIHYEMEY